MDDFDDLADWDRDDVRILLADIPEVEPPVSIRAAVLAAIDDPRAADRIAAKFLGGMSFAFADDGGFVPTPFPGVRTRVLSVDTARRQFTCLLRLEPGAVYPSHSHDGPEECIVLAGEIDVGGVRMRAGDYQRAEPGSDHVVQRSITESLLFLTAPTSLLK